MAAEFDETVAGFRNRPLDAGPYTFVWIDALTRRSSRAGRHRQRPCADRQRRQRRRPPRDPRPGRHLRTVAYKCISACTGSGFDGGMGSIPLLTWTPIRRPRSGACTPSTTLP